MYAQDSVLIMLQWDNMYLSSHVDFVSPPLSIVFPHLSHLDLKTLEKSLSLFFTIAVITHKCDFLLDHNWMLMFFIDKYLRLSTKREKFLHSFISFFI